MSRNLRARRISEPEADATAPVKVVASPRLLSAEVVPLALPRELRTWHEARRGGTLGPVRLRLAATRLPRRLLLLGRRLPRRLLRPQRRAWVGRECRAVPRQRLLHRRLRHLPLVLVRVLLQHATLVHARRRRRQGLLLVQMQVEPEHDGVQVSRTGDLQLAHVLPPPPLPGAIEEVLKHLLGFGEPPVRQLRSLHGLVVLVPAELVEGAEVEAVKLGRIRLHAHAVHSRSRWHHRGPGLQHRPARGLQHVYPVVTEQAGVEEVGNDEVSSFAAHLLAAL
mmetsp:Transcript_8947/g.31157  ORF Transcript_8947/g.31157 Transcript_8947/m.31157 type:complete len:280 (+) Transcript_8947:1612-2451(+)